VEVVITSLQKIAQIGTINAGTAVHSGMVVAVVAVHVLVMYETVLVDVLEAHAQTVHQQRDI
jgi:hypothetical protein